MKEKKLEKSIIYGITIFSLVLLAIFFIIQVLRIYFGNKDNTPIFTRELTIKYIMEILVLIILFVVVVIFGVIYTSIRHIKDKPLLSKRSSIEVLKTLMLSLPDEVNDDDKIKLRKEENSRKIFWLGAVIFDLICALFVFLYLFNEDHFISSGEPTSQVIKAIEYVGPFVLIGFAITFACVVYEEISAKRSIAIVKEILKNGHTKRTLKNPNQKVILGLRIGIITLAITLIIIGIVFNNPNDVFNKAAKICSECIGLG